MWNTACKEMCWSGFLRMKKACLFISIVCLWSVSPTYSFNGKPVGLFFGGNLGLGADVTQPIFVLGGEVNIGKTRINSSFLTDIKIGCWVNDHLGFLFATCNNWQAPYSEVILINSNFLGCRIYPLPGFMPVFLDGLIGFGFWRYPFDRTWNDYYSAVGTSFMTGIGYEISNHFSIHAGYMRLDASYSGSTETFTGLYEYIQRYNTHSIRFTLEYDCILR